MNTRTFLKALFVAPFVSLVPTRDFEKEVGRAILKTIHPIRVRQGYWPVIYGKEHFDTLREVMIANGIRNADGMINPEYLPYFRALIKVDVNTLQAEVDRVIAPKNLS